MTDTTAPRPYVPAFSKIYAAFDPIALLLLRVTLGLTLFPHGCQKLFGWFGGAGFEKFTGFFDKMGWYPPAFWVAVVALTELVGGLMLAFGFLTMVALVFLIRGGGRYSVDHALGREL
jgi:putative oxidoreductase